MSGIDRQSERRAEDSRITAIENRVTEIAQTVHGLKAWAEGFDRLVDERMEFATCGRRRIEVTVEQVEKELRMLNATIDQARGARWGIAIAFTGAGIIGASVTWVFQIVGRLLH